MSTVAVVPLGDHVLSPFWKAVSVGIRWDVFPVRRRHCPVESKGEMRNNIALLSVFLEDRSPQALGRYIVFTSFWSVLTQNAILTV
jgi:hypothetical protein